MRLRNDRRHDTASASTFALMISAVVMGGAIVIANTLVARPNGSSATAALYSAEATQAIEVMIRDAGLASSGVSWPSDADHLTRFGLALPGEPNFLDYVKIKSLRNGSLTGDANNGAPDYPEVKAAIGIKDADLHLRTYPVLPSLDDPRWTKEPNGRIAYVGHIDSAQGAATMTTYANTSGSVLNVSIAIRNDGADTMIFVADVGVGNLASATVIKDDQRHTRLLAPGEVQTVFVNFPKMAYSPAVTGVQVQLSDGYGNILIAPSWTAATAPTGTNVSWAPLVAADDIYFTTGKTVKFEADHFTGTGGRMSSAQTGRFVLVGYNGKEWVNTTVSLPKNKPYTFSCANCTTVGNYTATLWDSGVTRKAVDWVYVSAADLFQQTETLSPTSVKEISILQSLVTNFNGVSNDATHPEGDVFTDASHIKELADLLPRYTTLVVGSEVKQNALNSGQTKWGIADWVQAGGNLVVLGTYDSQSNWLEPVYHAAQTNANGGITAPDATHPILTTPEKLDYRQYLDRGRAWDIKDGEPFTHVLTRGHSGTSTDDTLAVANPGSLGNGTVVLTSYMPGSLTTPQNDIEAKRLMHNLLSQGYTMLYLDFGPPIPNDVPVGSTQRLVAIPHPNVPGAIVEVKFVMYVFG